MATYQDVITTAYYLSGVLSVSTLEIPTTAQYAFGLTEMNNILDSISNDPDLSSFLNRITFVAYTNEVWIGSGVTATDPTITVIDSPYFRTIMTGQFYVNNMVYPLRINLGVSVANTSQNSINYGLPRDVYYTMELQDNIPYNRLLFYPVPVSIVTQIVLYGIQPKETATLSTAVQPTFREYFEFKLAHRLSQLYKTQQWTADMEQTLLQLEKNIKAQTQELAMVNNNSNLLSTEDYYYGAYWLLGGGN